MIHIRCDYKVVFVFYKLKQILIHRLRSVHVSVDVDVTRPVGPHFLRCFVLIKASGIHVIEAVLFSKVGEILFEPLSAVRKTGGR